MCSGCLMQVKDIKCARRELSVIVENIVYYDFPSPKRTTSCLSMIYNLSYAKTCNSTNSVYLILFDNGEKLTSYLKFGDHLKLI